MQNWYKVMVNGATQHTVLCPTHLHTHAHTGGQEAAGPWEWGRDKDCGVRFLHRRKSKNTQGPAENGGKNDTKGMGSEAREHEANFSPPEAGQRKCPVVSLHVE